MVITDKLLSYPPALRRVLPNVDHRRHKGLNNRASGRQRRHRLNRGGNRDANRALWVIAIVRMASDPATQAYVRRRTQQDLSKREIVRCLKRYIARQLYRLLIASIAAPVGASITP